MIKATALVSAVTLVRHHLRFGSAKPDSLPNARYLPRGADNLLLLLAAGSLRRSHSRSPNDPAPGAGAIMDWRWDFTFDVVLPRLWEAAGITVYATFVSFAFALVGGLILMLLKMSSFKPVSFLASEVIEFIRGTPLLVQIFFLFFVLPQVGITLPPLTTGILAIAIYNSALTAEVYPRGTAGRSERSVGSRHRSQSFDVQDVPKNHHSPVPAADRARSRQLPDSDFSRRRRCFPSSRSEKSCTPRSLLARSTTVSTRR